MMSNDQMNADAREAYWQQQKHHDVTGAIETVINTEYDTERLKQMYADISGNYINRVTRWQYFEARQDQRMLQAIEDRLFQLR